MTLPIVFFERGTPVPVAELADSLDLTVREGDDATVAVDTIAPLEAAPSGSLTFIDNPKYRSALASTKAAVVVCNERNAADVPEGVVALVARQPYRAFAQIAGRLFPSAMRPEPILAYGISDGASIHPDAKLEDKVTVEHGAVIGANAEIGSGTLIGPGAIVGPNVRVGRDATIAGQASVLCAVVGNRVIIHSGVRIGSDGFGFSMGPQGHLKIPQIGRVVIQDDVEIGPNTCIDRGSNRDTIVGEGTKIDDLVMVGHNVVIGRHCVIVSQTGIAGSAEIGDFCVLGARAAINGHVKVGTGTQLAGLSGVASDVPPGSIYGGVPARPIRHWMKELGRLRREAIKEDRQRGDKQ